MRFREDGDQEHPAWGTVSGRKKPVAMSTPFIPFRTRDSGWVRPPPNLERDHDIKTRAAE